MSSTDRADRLLVQVGELPTSGLPPGRRPPTHGAVSIRVAGRLDARSVGQLRDELHRQLAAGHGQLVLDLSAAEIGDATALALLAGTHHRARRAGQRLVLGSMSARTARLLRLAHLDRVLAPEAAVVVA